MAALTEDKRRDTQGLPVQFGAPVAASTTIYAGALVCSDTNGFAVPAADTSGFRILGVACDHIDNSGGANGDLTVTVDQEHLEKIATSVLTQADVGGDAVVADDQTATDSAAATNDVRIGRIDRFETGFVWVRVGVLAAAAA